MAKKLTHIIMLMLLLISLLLTTSSFFVHAIDIEQDQTGIEDFYLYNELLQIANQGLENPYLKLETDALSLKEEISITNNQIESLEGLEKLNLSSLKTLNLSGNQIEVITSQMVSGLTNLEELNLSNNRITIIDVSGLPNLNVLNLENNNITQINISNITTNALLENGYVNLKNNYVESLSDITLPSELQDPILVDLNNNYLVNQTISSYTIIHSLNLMFQGVKQEDVLLEGSLLEVYETPDYVDFNVRIYDSQQVEVAQVLEGQVISLEANEYELKYFAGEVELYDTQTNLPLEFSRIAFTIKPNIPNAQIVMNGEVIAPQPVFTNIVEFTFLNENENAQFYYSINNSNWIEAEGVTLDKNGIYNLRIKAVVNSVESSIYSATMEIKIPFQISVSVVISILFIVLLVSIFLLGYYYYIKKVK